MIKTIRNYHFVVLFSAAKLIKIDFIRNDSEFVINHIRNLVNKVLQVQRHVKFSLVFAIITTVHVLMDRQYSLLHLDCFGNEYW